MSPNSMPFAGPLPRPAEADVLPMDAPPESQATPPPEAVLEPAVAPPLERDIQETPFAAPETPMPAAGGHAEPNASSDAVFAEFGKLFE